MIVALGFDVVFAAEVRSIILPVHHFRFHFQWTTQTLGKVIVTHLSGPEKMRWYLCLCVHPRPVRRARVSKSERQPVRSREGEHFTRLSYDHVLV